MILTIALNPSVVRKINLSNFKIGEMNISKRDELSVGDCGIYSAYVIKVMQGDPYVMGLSGGIGGRFIKNFLDRNRIKTDFLHVDHETKTLFLLEDDETKTLTTISSHNEEISNQDFVNIKHKLNHHIDDTDIITISGNDHYIESLLIEIHKMSKDRKKIILGAEGKALKSCIDKGVYSAVIDHSDLGSLGLSFPEDEKSYEAIKEFRQKYKIKYIIVRGNYEIVGITKNKICKVLYDTKDDVYQIVKSMTLGGLTIGVKRNYPFEKIMKLIGSIASGCSIDEYPFVIKRKEIDKGIKTTKLYEVYNMRNGYIESDKVNGSV